MNPLTRIKQNIIATVLDLPTELIVNICSRDVITLTDIFNLAICHSKLNNSLFHEQNSDLWKSKYIQKYGPLYKNEFEINIDEQNTWKNEISLRLSLDKFVSYEIEQMPGKYLRYKSVPYHSFPFTDHLHSKYQSRRFYVLSAVLTFYKRQLNDCFKKHSDVLYMTHLFLNYSCRVYFGYKLRDFLCSPITRQITEQGFYLLGRWWCPSDDTSYWDINNKFNDIAVKVCKTIQEINPLHPIVGKESGLDQICKRGQNILDHDLFNEISTICILDCLRQVMFANNNFIVCYCTADINCFLIKKVFERRYGSVLVLCVIFESVARRLGVKVKLTATSVHHFVSWSSSWPGHALQNPTCYLIDINANGIMREATICPVTKKLPDCFDLNSLPEMFWLFTGTMENIARINVMTYKFVLDFQKILKPNDSEVQFRYQKFHDVYDYCICPLLRDALNPHAPDHADVKNTMYTNWEDIFPLVPQTRGTNDDPKYSIGMMIDTITVGSDCCIKNKCGIIVGWTRVLSTSPSSKKTDYLYHVLIIHDNSYAAGKYQNPVIKSLTENNHEKLKRKLVEPFDYNFKNIGKYFKCYDYELFAFIPINDLAKLYPDDHSFTVSKSEILSKIN